MKLLERVNTEQVLLVITRAGSTLNNFKFESAAQRAPCQRKISGGAAAKKEKKAQKAKVRKKNKYGATAKTEQKWVESEDLQQ